MRLASKEIFNFAFVFFCVLHYFRRFPHSQSNSPNSSTGIIIVSLIELERDDHFREEFLWAVSAPAPKMLSQATLQAQLEELTRQNSYLDQQLFSILSNSSAEAISWSEERNSLTASLVWIGQHQPFCVNKQDF